MLTIFMSSKPSESAKSISLSKCPVFPRVIVLQFPHKPKMLMLK